MFKLLTPDRIDEFHDFVAGCDKGSFMQTKMWAAVKDNWINEVVLSVDEEDKIKGAMSLLIRKIPFFKNTIMYSPRGPVCDIADKETFAELVEGAKEVGKKYKTYVLKIDPDVRADNQEFRKICLDLGFEIKGENSKNFEGIQPKFVFRMDIKDKTEEEIFMSFHSKTRYNVRLAERKGVKVRVGNKDDLKRFHEIMEETGQRDEFVVRTLSYFEKMYDCLAPEYARLYMAEHEGKDIAGTFAIYFGDKVWYLYGASSNSARNVMPNYLLQWEMIKWAVEKKCRIYDFRGVSGDLDESNPLYGLYRFKKGFNGEFTEFIGELELVFNPMLNKLVDTSEKTFRELRRRVYLLKGKKK